MRVGPGRAALEEHFAPATPCVRALDLVRRLCTLSAQVGACSEQPAGEVGDPPGGSFGVRNELTNVCPEECSALTQRRAVVLLRLLRERNGVRKRSRSADFLDDPSVRFRGWLKGLARGGFMESDRAAIFVVAQGCVDDIIADHVPPRKAPGAIVELGQRHVAAGSASNNGGRTRRHDVGEYFVRAQPPIVRANTAHQASCGWTQRLVQDPSSTQRCPIECSGGYGSQSRVVHLDPLVVGGRARVGCVVAEDPYEFRDQSPSDECDRDLAKLVLPGQFQEAVWRGRERQQSLTDLSGQRSQAQGPVEDCANGLF